MRALCLLTVLLWGGMTIGAVDPGVKCKASKLKVAAKTVARLLKCHAKGARDGLPAKVDCLGKAGAGLPGAFTNIDSRGDGFCPVEGDADEVAAVIDAFVGSVVTALRPAPTGSGCASVKIGAVAKMAKADLTAEAKDAVKPDPVVLAARFAQARAALDGRFLSAEEKNDCLTGGDADSIAGLVDSVVADLLTPYSATLREVADATGRLVGAGVQPAGFFNEPTYTAILAREFNHLAPDYVGSWSVLEPTAGVWDFTAMDALVDFAEQNGMHVQFTPLVWYFAVPGWASALAPADFRTAVETHIRTVVARYRGRIQSYVTVNEAVDFGGTGLRQDVYLQKLGSGYLGDVFRWAHEEDPAALLFYNDFLAEGLNAKSDFIYALVQDLRSQGVPIHGVGFQCHFGLFIMPPASDIRQNIQRLGALGLQVLMTELDIITSGSTLVQQRRDYHDVVAACVAEPACKGVMTWGFTDRHSWLGSGARALPFDENYMPKPAYFGFRDALAGR